MVCDEPLDSVDPNPLRCTKPFRHAAIGDEWHEHESDRAHVRWKRPVTSMQVSDGEGWREMLTVAP